MWTPRGISVTYRAVLSFSPNGECQIRAEKESEPAAPGAALVLLVLT
jgi:hypothetical protein